VSIWVPPVGSLHDGETFEAAAVRELAEETGIAIGTQGPWIWTRRLRLRFEGRIATQIERYYVVRLPERPRRVANRSPEAIAALR
jgi:8-oxo-dGTP pyrophosphatase MutT (NUDIX family)